MRIDENGNVGIGTTTPARTLHVYNAGGNAQLALGDSSSYSTLQQSNGLYINAGEGGGAANTIFRYGAGFTESMRITNTGNVGIGTTNPNDGKLEVKGGTVCVDTNSDDSATSCIASESDERLKEKITALSASASLDTVLALRPVSFDWRVNDADVLAHYPLISRFAGNTHSIGLIAQEVMPVLPEALSLETVGDSEVQYYQLDYTKIIPHLIGAVQALSATLSDLATTVASFAERVTTKELVAINGDFQTLSTTQLCVGSVCVTQSDFLRVFGAAAASGQGSAPPDPAPSATSTPATTSPQAAATSSPPLAPADEPQPPAAQPPTPQPAPTATETPPPIPPDPTAP